MFFTLLHTDSQSQARIGKIFTAHGEIDTPIFMPVGTAGTVKAVKPQELSTDIQAEIILGNTYHLYLRPGCEVLQEAGGLHNFMQWHKPILTDSGGYQVFSLAAQRKIKEEGVWFRSHIDGSKHLFSPENATEIQRTIGADIFMAFDECPPYPCTEKYAKQSMELTHRWLLRCQEHMKQSKEKYGYPQYLFPIVQGSVFAPLRKQSAEFIATQNFEGNAIGGLSVGEPTSDMYAMTDIVCQILPKSKPRYLMGVGTPINLLENIALGIDMFDCVMPTRNARNGTLFTAHGTINIKNEKWKNDFSLIDNSLNNNVSNVFSKAYLRHLITSKEMLGAQIASIHNLSFYLWLMQEARLHIANDTFIPWKNTMVESLAKRL